MTLFTKLFVLIVLMIIITSITISLIIMLHNYWVKPQSDLIDFMQLSLPKRPNHCLVYGSQTEARVIAAPVLTYSRQQLFAKWQSIIHKQHRMSLIQVNHWHYQYVIYSRWLHYPDLVDVEFIALDHNHSSLYLYSRAIYGYYDFAVNLNRVRLWLAALKSA